MSRWIQNPEPPYQLIERESYVRPKEMGHFIQGDIEAFVSPIDKSIISDRKQYREHCEKHGVVPAAEFSEAYYQRKAQERADFYQGKVAKEESFKRKQAINEIIDRYERM